MAYKSKAELADEAEALGIDVGADWTREDIIDAIDAVSPGAEPRDDEPVPDATAEAAPVAEAGENLGYPHQPGSAPPSDG